MMQMKNRHSILTRGLRQLLLAAAALLPAACAEQAEKLGGADSDHIPVRLAVTVSEPEKRDITRASSQWYNNGVLVSGDQFYACFPDDNATVDNTVYTYQSASTITPQVQPFVRSGKTATIRCFAPWWTKNGLAKKVTEHTTAFTVEQDQSTKEHYWPSDLMYGEATIGADGTAAVTLSHRLSRLVFRLTRGQGISAITAVRLVRGFRTVNLTGGTATPGTELSDEISRQQPLLAYSSAVADADDQSLATGSYYPCCLIPPQTVQSGYNFIEIETPQGLAYYALKSNTAFATATQYTFQITVALANIGITTAVTPWEESDVTASTSQLPESHVFRVGNEVFQMNMVKGGEFSLLRGAAHTGQVSDFYMAQTEVTVGLYRAVMGDAAVEGNSVMKNVAPNYPMSYITWSQWETFVTELNSKLALERPAGWRFAMPTEAQWEYAARGGRARNTSNTPGYGYGGIASAADAAWYKDNSGFNTSANNYAGHPVATKKPNELGLYDMAGNVWEAVRDYSATLPADLGLDYLGTLGTYYYRGGTFKHNCNLTADWSSSNGVNVDSGLRLCLVPVPGAKSFAFNGATNTTGSVQTYTVPATGKYMLEVWGAEGGSGNGTVAYNPSDFLHSNSLLRGGKGGYTKTVVQLTKDQVLYIYVGGKGSSGGYGSNHTRSVGGWNGGGSGGVGSPSYNYGSCGAGGGATMICTADIGPIAQSGSGTVQCVVGNTDLLCIAGGGGGFGYSSSGSGGGVAGDTRAWTERYTGPVQQPFQLSVINNNDASRYEYIFWVSELNTTNTLINGWSEDYSLCDDKNADGPACLSTQSWGQNGGDYNQYTDTYTSDGDSNHTSGTLEGGGGGGGGGYYGGNARTKNGGVNCVKMWNRRMCVGGCGGTSWARGTRVDSWAGTLSTWYTEVGVRTGHGAATITPM